MKRQKNLALLLALALLLSLLSACSPALVSSSAAACTESSAINQPTSDAEPSPPETTLAPVVETSPALPSAVVFADDDEQLTAFLDGLVDVLNDPESDNLFYYDLDDGGVFFTISMPAFDYYYANIDSLSSSDLDAVRRIALDFVAGDFAEDLIAHIRSNGGASKSVYIVLGCNLGICMSSRDLSVFLDNLKR